MADRFWSGGIGLPSKAVSLQAARPILVARRAASSVRLGRSQTQSSLGSTLELGLIKNSIKMRPPAVIGQSWRVGRACPQSAGLRLTVCGGALRTGAPYLPLSLSH